MEETDGVVPATVPLSYKLSRTRSQKTLILGLTPESNLLKKLGFQSQESRFGSKIEDLDSVSREKGALKKLQTKDKTRDRISDMEEFKVYRMAFHSDCFISLEPEQSEHGDRLGILDVISLDSTLIIFLGTYPSKHTFSFSFWRW